MQGFVFPLTNRIPRTHTGTKALGERQINAGRDSSFKNSEVNLRVPDFPCDASPRANDLKGSGRMFAICIVRKQFPYLSKEDHLCCKAMFNCINSSG